MKKFISLTVLVASILLLFITEGCVPSKPTEDIEILPADRLIKRLEVNRRKIRNFEGVGTITIKTKEFDNSASFRVILVKPDTIYLNVLGPFGIELAQVLVSQKEFTFYDAFNNVAYTGSLNDDILKEIFKINLSFNDLIDAFIGSVNLTDMLYEQPSNYNIDYDKYVLTYSDSLMGTSTEFKVDIKELGITEFKKSGINNIVLLEGKYSKFNIIENVAVPYRIEVRNRSMNQFVSIDYRNITANKRDININFKLPTDATVISW